MREIVRELRTRTMDIQTWKKSLKVREAGEDSVKIAVDKSTKDE